MQWFVVIYLRVAASNAPTMCKQNGKLIYKRNYKFLYNWHHYSACGVEKLDNIKYFEQKGILFITRI